MLQVYLERNMTTDQHLTWCAVYNRSILAGIKPYIAVRMANDAVSKMQSSAA
jgi:hypothetical protein